MSQLVSPDRASHWYRFTDEQWTAFYECPKKDGKGMKAVTVREARETGAVPSVTNVLSVLARPGLEAWKATQYIEAALTLPKREGEPLDAYAKRVVEDADAKSATARDFGTRIHAAIEELLPQLHTGQIAPDVAPYVEPVRSWLLENVTRVNASELIVGSREIGVAGRLDLDCDTGIYGRVIIDFKTQGVKNGKATFYNEWGKQLAAYKACREEMDGCYIENIISLVIPSNAPMEPFVKVWEDIPRHLELFLCCLELWKDEKAYDPTKP